MTKEKHPISEQDHTQWMSKALALAAHAATLGEVPVGAVIVHHPTLRIIGTGYNERERTHDPTAHAEIVAMRAAAQSLKHWRLTDCTLYVTLEPCPMCAGAAVQARLPRLVYATKDSKAGAVDTLYQLCTDPRLNHRIEIIRGILEKEAATLLKTFFAQRREKRELKQTRESAKL